MFGKNYRTQKYGELPSHNTHMWFPTVHKLDIHNAKPLWFVQALCVFVAYPFLEKAHITVAKQSPDWQYEIFWHFRRTHMCLLSCGKRRPTQVDFILPWRHKYGGIQGLYIVCECLCICTLTFICDKTEVKKQSPISQSFWIHQRQQKILYNQWEWL